MAYAAANLTRASLEQLYAVLAEDKTVGGARKGVSLLNELVRVLNQVYRTSLGSVVDIAITDATDAGVSEFIDTGGEGVALAVLDVFRCTNATNDLTDNALATAKGSAVAANDVFVVDGADSVEYLGTFTADIFFDMSGETVDDFISIGA